jgi:hypothetical protein
MTEIATALAGSLALAACHALTRFLHRLPPAYGGTLAGISGGVGLAYVFLYLLFELATEGAPHVHALIPIGPQPLGTLFILLLVAVSTTHLIAIHLEQTVDRQDDHRGYALLFIAYNFLAGAGAWEEAHWGGINLAFYVAAIGLHLLANERFLLHLCPEAHTWPWRCALAGAPVLGCLLAIVLGPQPGMLYTALTLVAGGTIITVIRRELPDRPNFNLVGFVLGLAGYAALIHATWRF